MPQKRAMVTGASEGIGREFARQLAAEGWQITGVARNEVRLQELCEGLGEGHRYIVADLSTAGGVEAAAAELKANHYELLINNAGYGVKGKFYELPLEKHLSMLHVNVRALVTLSHVFLGQAKAGDALINVSSSLGFLPMPSLGLYAASKALVTSLSESLWHEQKSRGVYVMGLCPGVTNTEFSRHSGGTGLKSPGFMVQSCEALVAKALRELKARRKPTVLSGAVNIIFSFLSRFQSRKMVVTQMGVSR